MQNIGRANQNDPHFRYKMPKLIGKQEGKGNGKKTIVVNIFDIGKALARPSEHPMKFMGYELGCIATYDSKKDADRGGTLMGWHDQNDLAEKLDDYIDNFVLCPECGNPETMMDIDKRGKITLQCKACPAKSSELPLPNHKLAKYIVQHPEQIGIAKAGADKLSKEDKRRLKIEAQKKKEAGEAGAAAAAAESAVDEKAVKKAAKAAKKAAKEAAKESEVEAAKSKLHGYQANKTGYEIASPTTADDEEDDDPWIPDDDDEAAREQRREEFFSEDAGKGSKVTLVDDDDETRIEILRARLSATADKKAVVDHFKEERGGLKDVQVVCYLVEAAFTADVINDIKTYASVLKPYCQGPKMEKCQAALVLGLEELIGERFPEQLNTNRVVPKIFEALYDNDLVNEEVIILWFDKGLKGYRIDKGLRKSIRENCAAFANWLKEAEEDDSDEE